MDDSPVNTKLTDDVKAKLREFDEQEAYFLLCQIIAYAQVTGDYAKFQSDLYEWKKRYNVELFSDDLKSKIKYMLSNEFLDKVLKDFLAFDEMSKKNPATGLEKLRKILDRAEKHKNSKKLDKDLESLYKEYPLSFLKSKYPHIVKQLLSPAYLTKILEKFDSELAYNELEDMLMNPSNFSSFNDFKSSIDEWQKLYPLEDFSEEFKPQIEKKITEELTEEHLKDLFASTIEPDLTGGIIIPIENISLLSKNALADFMNIADRNIGDIDSLFDWVCKYNRYINEFDPSVKEVITEQLLLRYRQEMPNTPNNYHIPKMNNDYFLSLSDFESIEDTKKVTLLQLLGMLSSGQEMTHEDCYRINIIRNNSNKAKAIEEANINTKVEEFIKEVPEEELTPITISSNDNSTVEISDENLHVEMQDDSVSVNENNQNTFKESLRLDDKELERVEASNPNSSSDTTTGASSSGGGGGISVQKDIPETPDEEIEEDIDVDEEPEQPVEDKNSIISNLINLFRGKKQKAEPDIQKTTNSEIESNKLDQDSVNDLDVNEFDDPEEHDTEINELEEFDINKKENDENQKEREQ